MKPCRRTNRIIGGILARYAEIFGITIYALNFLSNHYHLAIKAPLSNADEFEENVNREIARRLNWKNHRQGRFWESRYKEQTILGEDDLLEAFLYITANAVKHGLVSSPELWPGLNSYTQSLTGASKTYTFEHYSAQEGEERVTFHELKITPLPQFASLTKKRRKRELERLIAERTLAYQTDRKQNGEGFLTAEIILDQLPTDLPKKISRAPQPSCYSKDPARIKEYRIAERTRCCEYKEASSKFRLGDRDVEFPKFTFQPPTHRKPRLAPFRCLPDDYFKNAA